MHSLGGRMNKSLLKLVVLFSLLGVAQSSLAKDWFGKNNRFGGFGNSFGNGNNCNDWPEWTPMYWMEEMMDNNDNCYPSYGYAGGYSNINPYQSPYPYGAGGYTGISPYANPYLANPYMAQAGVYPQTNTRSMYGARKYGSQKYKRSSPFGIGGLTGFPRLGGNRFANPFSSFNGGSSPFSSPFSSFGSGSPWSSYSSPMSFGAMPGMSPFSPMGSFGSPMSPMSPMSMGTLGMPGMSPMSGFGGSPFSPFGGGSSFMPFR